jgi:hypothetical protein
MAKRLSALVAVAVLSVLVATSALAGGRWSTGGSRASFYSCYDDPQAFHHVYAPYKSQGKIHGRATFYCSQQVRLATMRVRIMQYRGAGIWREKAERIDGPRNGKLFSADPVWHCAGTGSGTQTYKTSSIFMYENANGTFAGAVEKSSKQVRITCN